ncbi:uncharacterized protein [Solanum lycopersicum]|uniref:uncharacterized protein n=1 Tax=Solanum lycopersicum TaxID=4081 RepID=UPI0002BCA959|nr:uncharacterized protein LOC112941696 [Solanum lycopersicum]
MASYGAVVQRPSATSANHPSQTQPDESKQLPNFEKNQPFSFQVTCPVSIPTTPESAATRIIKNLGKFGLYYAEFVWIVLFIALIPKPFDTRLIVLPLLAIGTCVALILTNAGIHLVITLAATLPIILAHAVLWIAEDSSFNDETNQESVPFVHTV